MTTREQIIAAAREAGLVSANYRYDGTDEADWKDIERFYIIAFEAGRKSVDIEFALAEAYRCGEEAGRQAERETCAAVCERLISGDGICADNEVWIHDCAEAIRARGDSK